MAIRCNPLLPVPSDFSCPLIAVNSQDLALPTRLKPPSSSPSCPSSSASSLEARLLRSMLRACKGAARYLPSKLLQVSVVIAKHASLTFFTYIFYKISMKCNVYVWIYHDSILCSCSEIEQVQGHMFSIVVRCGKCMEI